MRTILLTLLSAVALSASSTRSTAEKEVLAAMDAYKQAYLHKDIATMDKLFSSDISYSHAEVGAMNKEAILKNLTAAPTPRALEFLPDTAIRIDGQMAFITGHVDLSYADMFIPGELGIIKHMYVTHVWEKTAEGWHLLCRQATLISIEPASTTTASARH